MQALKYEKSPPTVKSFFQSVARGSVLYTRSLRIGGLERPVSEADTLVAPDGSLYGYLTMMLGGRWTLSAFKTNVDRQTIAWKEELCEDLPLCPFDNPVRASVVAGGGDLYLIYLYADTQDSTSEESATYKIQRLSQLTGNVRSSQTVRGNRLAEFHLNKAFHPSHRTGSDILLGERCHYTEEAAHLTVLSLDLRVTRVRKAIKIPTEDEEEDDECTVAHISFFQEYCVLHINKKSEGDQHSVVLVIYKISRGHARDLRRTHARYTIPDTRFVAPLRDSPGTFVLEEVMEPESESESEQGSEEESEQESEQKSGKTALCLLSYPRNLNFLWDVFFPHREQAPLEVVAPPYLEGFPDNV